jgi:hypothetical protein
MFNKVIIVNQCNVCDDEYNRLQCQKLDREYSIFELQLVEDWSFYWLETDGRRSRWTPWTNSYGHSL